MFDGTVTFDLPMSRKAKNPKIAHQKTAPQARTLTSKQPLMFDEYTSELTV